MNILVVDDSDDWRDLTTAALAGVGHDMVAEAGSARDAYAKLGIEPHGEAPAIDLIILDVLMPGIDGIEACARIRSDARYADVPVIMVTSLHDIESLSNAFVAGATDYVTKPFNRVELLARVRSALKLKSEFDRRKSREDELVALNRLTYGEGGMENWIDGSTGFLAGRAAEAYLLAALERTNGDPLSVFALVVDGLDALCAAHGPETRGELLACVSAAVRGIVAPIGVTPAAYNDGIIVLVAPHVGAREARVLGETLRDAVCRLGIVQSESVTSDVVTASIGVVTGRAGTNGRRGEFLADARATAKSAAAAGGNRVAALDLSVA